MSVDHLPARTALAANDTGDGIATRTATVLNAEDVHRDWRQVGADATGSGVALTAGAALYLAAFEKAPALMWASAVGCAVLAVACIAFLILTAREGRRWTYATDPDTP